jgi:hypothetical protein
LSFYIGPIHFNASGSGFDFENERNESLKDFLIFFSSTSILFSRFLHRNQFA